MRAVVVHAVLAVLGLGLAYQAFTREAEPEEVPGEVTVAECGGAALDKLNLESPTHFVLVEPQRQKDETLYWITTRRKTTEEIDGARKAEGEAKLDAAKTTPPSATPKAAVDPTAPKRFLANAAFVDYLGRFAPLRAARSLGELPKDRLVDFGFDKVGTRLQVRCGGKTIDLEVGARTFGTSQRYLRDAKNKASYLFDEVLVSDLQSAQHKFMQTDLHAFAQSEIDAATIEAKGGKKRLVHRDRKVDGKALWVDASAPDKRNELYGNWFSRLSRLRVRDYLPQGAGPGSDLAPAAAEFAPVLTLSYELEGKPKGKLELVRVDGGGEPRYYARTETTRGWVSVYDSSAKDVEQDLALVVGVEERAAEPAPAPAP